MVQELKCRDDKDTLLFKTFTEGTVIILNGSFKAFTFTQHSQS